MYTRTPTHNTHTHTHTHTQHTHTGYTLWQGDGILAVESRDSYKILFYRPLVHKIDSHTETDRSRDLTYHAKSTKSSMNYNLTFTSHQNIRPLVHEAVRQTDRQTDRSRDSIHQAKILTLMNFNPLFSFY